MIQQNVIIVLTTIFQSFCRKWDTTTSTLEKIKEVFKKPVETLFDLEDVYNNVKQILDEDEKTT